MFELHLQKTSSPRDVRYGRSHWRHFFYTLIWLCLLEGIAPSQVKSANASESSEASPRFVIIEEPGAPGKLDPKKLERCLRLMEHELGVEGRALPRIMIYHLSETSARYLGVSTSTLYRNTGSGTLRYEMWVVGEPSNIAYSYVFENILTKEFGLKIAETEREHVLQKVERSLDATVDVKSFR